MEPECLERLFIVFESEGALAYHMERCHRLGAKVKQGKTTFDATKLLGLQLDHNEEELDEEEVEALQGMDLDLLDETAKEMQRQGLQVPELVLQMLAKAKSKQKKVDRVLKNKIELRDNQGKDMTRIVIIVNSVSKGRWRPGRFAFS